MIFTALFKVYREVYRYFYNREGLGQSREMGLHFLDQRIP